MADVVPTLRKLHNLETMAVQIYRAQLPRLADPGEREIMAAAMENETLHRETFRALLEKRGTSPSPLRALWWLVGQALGRATALLGRSTLFSGDVAFEEKAVREYAVFVGEGGFTGEERAFLARFLEDERRHVANWKGLLDKGR